MKKRTTLKKFIENFSIKNFREDPLSHINLKELSYENAYKLSLTGPYYGKVLSSSNEYIYFGVFRVQILRNGKSFYKHSVTSEYIRVGLDGITIKCGSSLLKEFLKLCNITWAKELNEHLFSHTNFIFHKSILKSILIGSIYNQETFYKALGKRIYHCNLSWKLIRDYIDFICIDPYYNAICISDLCYFTTNAEVGLKRYMNESGNVRLLLKDVLHCAVQLNQTVNFSWSAKRLNEEHKKQVMLLTEKEIATKSNTSIYENCLIPNIYIKLLNSEAEIFYEGKSMHHCVYNCYYDRIKKHNYMALHMTSPEDCTIGIELNKDNEPYLHQIYLKYDVAVKDTTRDLAIKYIEENVQNLKEMFNQKVISDQSLEEDLLPEILF